MGISPSGSHPPRFPSAALSLVQQSRPGIDGDQLRRRYGFRGRMTGHPEVGLFGVNLT